MRKKIVTVMFTVVLAASAILGGCRAPQETGGRAEDTEQTRESEESRETDGDVIAENYLDTDMVVGEAQPTESEVPGETVFSSFNGVATLSEAKLLKEEEREKNKEALVQIINSDELSEGQKREAIDALVQMGFIAEREEAAEILLEEKGFSDVMVSINDGTVDVVVNALTLTDAQRAQIEDIVKRKTQIGAENIVISTVVQE